MRTQERNGVSNLKLPVRGGLSSVALELWHDIQYIHIVNPSVIHSAVYDMPNS